jgi:SAM-dependent methyltransferase
MKTELPPSLAVDYEAKQRDYFDRPRGEMLAFLPQSCRRVLDVGCGNGEFAAAVKAKLNCEAWGVEPSPKSARFAVGRLDRVMEGCFNRELKLPLNYFDCIVFNDVLEHMLDPGSALGQARDLLTQDGVVVASIPNIGHFPTVWRLVMKGQWEYRNYGILDRTHLRFFTRKSIFKMFEGENYEVERMRGINAFSAEGPGDRKLWMLYRVLALFPRASIRDMRYLQFATVARQRRNPAQA